MVILLPAREEEEAISSVLASLPRDALAERGFEVDVVVVDGRSEDRTASLARAHGARVIVQGSLGKGLGVREALATLDADYFVMLDADNTYPSEEIPHFLEVLLQGYDVVMGSRLRGHIHQGAMSPLNGFGNRALSLAATVLYGRRCTDVCTGMWAFRKSLVDALPLTSRRFEIEAELYALSVRAGLRIIERPIEYRRRLGRTKLGRIRDGVTIAYTLVTRRFSKLTLRLRPGPPTAAGRAPPTASESV